MRLNQNARIQHCNWNDSSYTIIIIIIDISEGFAIKAITVTWKPTTLQKNLISRICICWTCHIKNLDENIFSWLWKSIGFNVFWSLSEAIVSFWLDGTLMFDLFWFGFIWNLLLFVQLQMSYARMKKTENIANANTYMYEGEEKNENFCGFTNKLK